MKQQVSISVPGRVGKKAKMAVAFEWKEEIGEGI